VEGRAPHRRNSSRYTRPVMIPGLGRRTVQARRDPKSRVLAVHSPYRVLAGENISARFVVPTVASTVDIVVQVGIDSDGRRRVREIVGVPGRVEADVIETEPIFSWQLGGLQRAHGMPPRLESFVNSGIDVHQLLAADQQPAEASGG
jgi:pilus assembly protein CpaF